MKYGTQWWDTISRVGITSQPSILALSNSATVVPLIESDTMHDYLMKFHMVRRLGMFQAYRTRLTFVVISS